MRGSAALAAIFILSLLVVGVAEADTYDVTIGGFISESYVISEDITDDALCRVTHNQKYENPFYLYSGVANQCGQFVAPGEDIIRGGFNYDTAGASTLLNADPPLYPTIRAVGLGYDSEIYVKPVIFMEAKPLGSAPTSEWFTYLSAGQCANILDISFHTRTNLPDIQNVVLGWDQPESSIPYGPERWDSAKKCRDRVFEKVFPEFAPGFQERFQGLYISTTTPYELPLFCDDIAVEIIEGESGSWDNMKGNYQLSVGSYWNQNSNRWLWTRTESDDYATFRFTYNKDTGILRDYSVKIDDTGSGAAGGIAYNLKCEAYDPTTRQVSCEELDYGWAEGAGCCHPEIQGTTATADDGIEYFCNAENAWVVNDAENCPLPQNGQRLPGDDEGYCCEAESVDENRPHHIDDTAESPWFCSVDEDGGDLISAGTNAQERASISYNWAWDGTTWELCDGAKEAADDPTHGTYLCTKNFGNTIDASNLGWKECNCDTPFAEGCGEETVASGKLWYCAPPPDDESEPYWTSQRDVEGACTEDDAINGRCCYRAMYFIEADETNGYTLACYDGLVISEQQSSTLAGPAAEVYVEDPTA